MATTAATAAPQELTVPDDGTVIRVPVAPDQTVTLPFPTENLVARLGDNGNLAIKSGDTTVILLGYTAAVDAGEVTVVGSDGDVVDIAAVLAATDPAIDIETAAGGPGDLGDAVDNNGGVFTPFDPASGIGGFAGSGGLAPTALQYELVEREAFVDLEDEDDEEEETVPTTPPPPDGEGPVNLNDSSEGAENQSRQDNVLIVLDRSNSMNDDADGAGPGTQTRLDIARAAVVDLLAKYDQVSDVRVLIVQFATNGERMQMWGTPAEALAYIDANEPAGPFTSYSDALIQARNGLNDVDGKIPGAPTTVYFISDGEPNADGANPGIGGVGVDHSLSAAQQTAWNNVLEAQNVTVVHAIGIGADVVDGDDDLADVANPNGNPNNTPLGNVEIIQDPTQLSGLLQDTVAATTISGNVLDGQDTSGIGDNGTPGDPDTEGAGGAYIHTFQHDGAGFAVEFAWDGVAPDVTQIGAGGVNVTVTGTVVAFDTEHGRMSFDFASGGYEFVPGDVDAEEDVTFHYGTTDFNGDTDQAGGIDDDNANTVPGGADLVITVTNTPPVPAIAAQDVVEADATLFDGPAATRSTTPAFVADFVPPPEFQPVAEHA